MKKIVIVLALVFVVYSAARLIQPDLVLLAKLINIGCLAINSFVIGIIAANIMMERK